LTFFARAYWALNVMQPFTLNTFPSGSAQKTLAKLSIPLRTFAFYYAE